MTLQIPITTYGIAEPDHHVLKPMLNPTYCPEISRTYICNSLMLIYRFNPYYV